MEQGAGNARTRSSRGAGSPRRLGVAGADHRARPTRHDRRGPGLRACRSARNGRNCAKGRISGPRIPTAEGSARIIRASVMSCRNKLAKSCPNRDVASATRTTGVRQARRPARRCQQCVGDGRCRRVDAVRIRGTTQIGEFTKTRVDTALKIWVKPSDTLSARSAGRPTVTSIAFNSKNLARVEGSFPAAYRRRPHSLSSGQLLHVNREKRAITGHSALGRQLPRARSTCSDFTRRCSCNTAW